MCLASMRKRYECNDSSVNLAEVKGGEFRETPFAVDNPEPSSIGCNDYDVLDKCLGSASAYTVGMI